MPASEFGGNNPVAKWNCATRQISPVFLASILWHFSTTIISSSKPATCFPEIGRRVKAFCDANPEAAKRLIRCGIGDVTEPLPPAVIAAMHKAVDEMAARETFKGYGPEQGYEWLRARHRPK